MESGLFSENLAKSAGAGRGKSVMKSCNEKLLVAGIRVAGQFDSKAGGPFTVYLPPTRRTPLFLCTALHTFFGELLVLF